MSKFREFFLDETKLEITSIFFLTVLIQLETIMTTEKNELYENDYVKLKIWGLIPELTLVIDSYLRYLYDKFELHQYATLTGLTAEFLTEKGWINREDFQGLEKKGYVSIHTKLFSKEFNKEMQKFLKKKLYHAEGDIFLLVCSLRDITSHHITTGGLKFQEWILIIRKVLSALFILIDHNST